MQAAALTNDLNAKGTAAQNSLGAYQAAGANAADAGSAHVDQGVLNNINGSGNQVNWTANNVLGTTAPITGAKAATGTAANYSGPSDISHLTGDAAAAQAKAYSDTQNATDSVGQVTGGFDKLGAYLKSQNKDPSYTAGENNLDTFLTGASDPGSQAIQGAHHWDGLGNQATAADTAVTNAISRGQAATGTVQKTYDDATAARQAGSDAAAAKYNSDYGIAKAAADRSAAQQAKQDAAAKASPFATPQGSTGYTQVAADSRKSPFATPTGSTGYGGNADILPTGNVSSEYGVVRDENGNPITSDGYNAGAHGGKVMPQSKQQSYSNLLSMLRNK